MMRKETLQDISLFNYQVFRKKKHGGGDNIEKETN